MKTIAIFLFCSIAATHVQAQTRFLSEGRIEFEKKLNLHSQFSADDTWFAEIKKNLPQFKVSYFELSFAGNTTLFKPGRENPDNNKLWFQEPAEDNVIYSELDKHHAVSQKNIFEKTFLVNDSTRSINWKITDEKRTIAGFECRRANALILDSIYIVAFYTDEILTPGGPESFSGLPGMILGLAIPHEHVTWFATKLYTVPMPASELKAPLKGSKTTNAGMKEYIQSSLKNWGKWGDRYVKAAML